MARRTIGGGGGSSWKRKNQAAPAAPKSTTANNTKRTRRCRLTGRDGLGGAIFLGLDFGGGAGNGGAEISAVSLEAAFGGGGKSGAAGGGGGLWVAGLSFAGAGSTEPAAGAGGGGVSAGWSADERGLKASFWRGALAGSASELEVCADSSGAAGDSEAVATDSAGASGAEGGAGIEGSVGCSDAVGWGSVFCKRRGFRRGVSAVAAVGVSVCGDDVGEVDGSVDAAGVGASVESRDLSRSFGGFSSLIPRAWQF